MCAIEVFYTEQMQDTHIDIRTLCQKVYAGTAAAAAPVQKKIEVASKII